METTAGDGYRENFYDTVADEATENPEEIALREEVETRADKFVAGFLDELGDDDFLVGVVEQLIDGLEKPRELAAALGVQVQEVYKARKRLSRRLDDYRSVRLNIGQVS